jgi:hypothetical protein
MRDVPFVVACVPAGVHDPGVWAFDQAHSRRRCICGGVACPATTEPQVPLSAEEVERVGKYLAGAGLR